MPTYIPAAFNPHKSEHLLYHGFILWVGESMNRLMEILNQNVETSVKINEVEKRVKESEVLFRYGRVSCEAHMK